MDSCVVGSKSTIDVETALRYLSEVSEYAKTLGPDKMSEIDRIIDRTNGLFQIVRAKKQEYRAKEETRIHGLLHDSMDEVYPGIFISGIRASLDLTALQRYNITTIISVAAGIRPRYPEKFRYLVVDVEDKPETDIVTSSAEALGLLAECQGKGEAVLVHCHAGVSRSVSVVCLYLMQNHGMAFFEALSRIKERRHRADPNVGFRMQLAKLDKK